MIMKKFILITTIFLSYDSVASIIRSTPDIKGPSQRDINGRNLDELGNISEPTEMSNRATRTNPIQSMSKSNADTSKVSTLSESSCRTYEGREFEKGEAGYNDCIRKINNDRQDNQPIP